jgi:hypothetical protein
MHHTESLADGALGGGGIYALDSKISILRSYLEDAATEDAAELGQCGNGQFGWGGEIDYVDDGVTSNQSRSLTIVQSSIRGAAGCRGGAIVYNSTVRSSLVIQNSTIAQNIGVISGGGLYLVGRGSVNLMGNTIASNTAATSTSDGSPINRVGGGIAFDGFTGSLTMQGNIVAQNVAQFSKRTDGTSIPDSNDCYILGAFASSRTTSFNLVGKQGNCSFLPVGPLVGTATAPVDPRLGTFEGFLGMYGWSGFLAMFTGLQPGSAAITGNGGTCLSADEREFSRTSTGCDIGAYQTSCLHDPCKAGPNLVPDCGDCVARICDVDPFCCASLWDPICVGEVSSVCGLTCQ